jgi:hypothetical protein
MATVKIKQFRTRQFGGAAGAYGNVTALPFRLTTNASGAAVDSDTAAAIGSGDKVVLGTLPAGMRLDDSIIVASVAMTALVTGSLGFEYADGVDDAAVPQDAAYFGSGIVLSTAARLRNASSKAIVTLPKTANLILTTAGAANAKASQLDIVVQGELTGQK